MKSRKEVTARNVDESRPAQRGTVDRIFHKLARIFNGFHWAIGITILPATATARDERSFVLMWLGIIVFMIVFFAVLIYILGSI
jgi:hypothetical protein